ncbi:AAA family ATPase [Myxococcus xanthus]|uniref:AAA family ATPase n=1 Tax=Myxococcus xanthus TaxID=34 RepID=UPI00112E7AB0|nr:ATP-binding protein [Myxococcus xanthus]
MLTRLKVDGFKNLDGVDVRFGPFTCVAGPNGVGKSNLFDAIAFLATLADKPLMEAALVVRGGDARRGDVRSLFRKLGPMASDRMRFLVEMIIPKRGQDELGQTADASMTFLQYELELRYRPDPTIKSAGTLMIAHERMVHVNRGDAKAHLGFHHKKAWRDSVVQGRRTSPYISTEEDNGVAIVALHADSEGGKTGGRPRRVPASSLPRTMLSSVNNAAEHRTLVLARQEMMSWTQLQLEPSALRAPDSFTAPRSIGANGAHLPATLYELAQQAEQGEAGGGENVYADVANRLSQLVENVRNLSVEVDEKRQLLNIVMTDRHDTEHVASALSDGTLRFLALTVMEADPKSRSLLCLEEPENGMHPLRIPAVIELLSDLAVDVNEPVDDDNPLRQVVINTHSPSVVACVHDDALLVGQAVQVVQGGSEEARLTLRHLPETWRCNIEPKVSAVTRGDLLAYLNPLLAIEEATRTRNQKPGGTSRVMERKDLQLSLFDKSSEVL